MNIFFKTILFFTLALSIGSCTPDSDNTEPLRDYATQHAADIANIETFMKTHYMEVINNPGATNDQDVTYTLIPAGGSQVSIWDQTTYPIQTRYVNQNDITYKIYFIQLRQGSGPTSKAPCNVDSVLTSYRGEYIFEKSETVNEVVVKTIEGKEFEESKNPQAYFNLTRLIKAWGEIFPQFKTGSYGGNPDGTISYTDFGAGVMFIPSGLAYFSGTQSGIMPSYSPLIFSIKLYEVQRVDQDGDGIFTFQEDLATSIVASNGTVTIINGIPDGYVNVLPTGTVNPDDTDGDGIPDFLDVDDDGDFFTTKSELKYISSADPQQRARYYPFDGDAVDNPATPFVDESQGAPDCSGNFTNAARLRKYRDPSCH